MSDDKRATAQGLYAKLFAFQDQNIGSTALDAKRVIAEERTKIKLLITQSLCSCHPQKRFQHPEFPNIIVSSSNMDCFEPTKAAEAFINLENYVILICLMPWRAEFHKLKKYGGFYQTKIDSHLANASSIFRLAGFVETTAGLLELKLVQSVEYLLNVAFECYVASIECGLIDEVWQATRDTGVHLKRIIKWRAEVHGTPADLANVINSKYTTSVVASDRISDNHADSHVRSDNTSSEKKSDVTQDPVMLKNSSTDAFRTRLNNHIQNWNDIEDIPFMDDVNKAPEYTAKAADFDEHLLASFQLVEDKDGEPTQDSKQDLTKGSQEWAFVSDGLEQKYGKRYFDGPRKDILSKDKGGHSNNAPYVKLMATDPKAPKYVNCNDMKHENNPEFNLLAPSAVTSGKDSAYISSSISAMEVQTPSPRGSGIQLQKHPAVHRNNSGYDMDTRLSNSEPIVKRAPMPAPHAMQAPTYTYGAVHNPPVFQQSAGGGEVPNMEQRNNIQKLSKSSKHASMSNQPAGSDVKQFVAVPPTQPRSASENMGRRNVTDGRKVDGAKTVNIPPIAVPQSNPKTWSCSHCTYLNSLSDIVCMICSKSREFVDVDSPPHAGHVLRVCSKCTLENEKDAQVCHACGNQLCTTQTVV